MKVFLMYQDRDFELDGKLPSNEEALIQDLELNALFNAMALGDKFLFEVVRKAFLGGLHNDLATIRYRQSILQDCLKNPSILRDIYDIAEESIENKRRHYIGIFGRFFQVEGEGDFFPRCFGLLLSQFPLLNPSG